MSEMKVVSWNVNSIRTRLTHVLDWIDSHQPDLLCLQETKVKDEQFPLEEFEKRGLNVHIHGQPAYNGVALITPHALVDVEKGFPEGDLFEQRRFIAATLNGVRVINVYAPQGESPESPKFEMKEAFYRRLARYVKENYTPDDALLICGDFNIAPDARDVDDPAKREGKCMFHPLEHAWLENLTSWGLHDSFRLKNDEAGHFSWWDYRQNAYALGRGCRIDQLWISTPLVTRVCEAAIDETPRAWDKPSDHVPVYVTLTS